MRVLHVVEAQRRYVASLDEAPTPTVRPGEVLVHVAASGLNRADLSQIAGRYPPPPGEPEGLGLEVSGTVKGSGVGLAAIQVAKYLGARVVATTRTREKIAALERADLAVHAPTGDFAGAIAAQLGSDAVDVVLDPVGAATLAQDLAVLAPRGQVICLAALSGAQAEVDVSLLMRKQARIVGSMLRSR